MRVFRISRSRRGSTPGRDPGGAKATPLGATTRRSGASAPRSVPGGSSSSLAPSCAWPAAGGRARGTKPAASSASRGAEGCCAPRASTLPTGSMARPSHAGAEAEIVGDDHGGVEGLQRAHVDSASMRTRRVGAQAPLCWTHGRRWRRTACLSQPPHPHPHTHTHTTTTHTHTQNTHKSPGSPAPPRGRCTAGFQAPSQEGWPPWRAGGGAGTGQARRPGSLRQVSSGAGGAGGGARGRPGASAWRRRQHCDIPTGDRHLVLWEQWGSTACPSPDAPPAPCWATAAGSSACGPGVPSCSPRGTGCPSSALWTGWGCQGHALHGAGEAPAGAAAGWGGGTAAQRRRYATGTRPPQSRCQRCEPARPCGPPGPAGPTTPAAVARSGPGAPARASGRRRAPRPARQPAGAAARAARAAPAPPPRRTAGCIR